MPLFRRPSTHSWTIWSTRRATWRQPTCWGLHSSNWCLPRRLHKQRKTRTESIPSGSKSSPNSFAKKGGHFFVEICHRSLTTSYVWYIFIQLFLSLSPSLKTNQKARQNWDSKIEFWIPLLCFFYLFHMNKFSESNSVDAWKHSWAKSPACCRSTKWRWNSQRVHISSSGFQFRNSNVRLLPAALNT